MSNDQILYLGLIFVAVVAGVMGIGMVFTRGADVRQRLRGLAGGETVLEQPPEASVWTERVVKAAAPVARLATPTSEEDVSNLRARFLHAGIRSTSAPVEH